VVTIAYQGEPGAYSEIAAMAAVPGATALACSRFEDAFAAVEGGMADMAIIPIENSVAGRVADVHGLLPKSPLSITAEHFEPVHHHLLALPGMTLERVQTVASHPMALAQVQAFMHRHAMKTRAHIDTAGAAKALANGELGVDAVIASARAGALYGLISLAAHIEDDAQNTTRFCLFEREARLPHAATTRSVTALFFRTRSVPAALYKCLGGFATNGVNISKLESYLAGGSMFAAQFYLEAEAHPDDHGLAHALDELRFFSEDLRIIGVFPGHEKRWNGLS
jgi:prephenate dehydratase